MTDKVKQALMGVEQQHLYVKLKIKASDGQLCNLFGSIPVLLLAPPMVKAKFYNIEVIHHSPTINAAVTRLTRVEIIDSHNVQSWYCYLSLLPSPRYELCVDVHIVNL